MSAMSDNEGTVTDEKAGWETGAKLVGIALVVILLGVALASLRTPRVAEQPSSLSVTGLFGYAGEAAAPTTLVLVRADTYRRMLVASTGVGGAVVVDAARFSATTYTLQAVDLNGDEYEDVIACGLVLYGAPGGLVLWETE